MKLISKYLFPIENEEASKVSNRITHLQVGEVGACPHT